MDRDKIIETYVEKLNDECRHRKNIGFMKWSYCDLIGDSITEYCFQFNVYDTDILYLCDTCKKNLREFKKEVSDDVVLSVQTYEHILSELRELRYMINELKKQ